MKPTKIEVNKEEYNKIFFVTPKVFGWFDTSTNVLQMAGLAEYSSSLDPKDASYDVDSSDICS